MKGVKNINYRDKEQKKNLTEESCLQMLMGRLDPQRKKSSVPREGDGGVRESLKEKCK
jgi:hypothetical protein